MIGISTLYIIRPQKPAPRQYKHESTQDCGTFPI